MPASKRVALAFCSLIAVTLGYVFLVAFQSASHIGWKQTLGGQPAYSLLGEALLYLVFASPGWLLAMPFVLGFRDAKSGRLWWILGIGTATGPIVMLSYQFFYAADRIGFLANGNSHRIAPSLWICFPTTLLYALLLRHFTRQRNITAATNNT